MSYPWVRKAAGPLSPRQQFYMHCRERKRPCGAQRPVVYVVGALRPSRALEEALHRDLRGSEPRARRRESV